VLRAREAVEVVKMDFLPNAVTRVALAAREAIVSEWVQDGMIVRSNRPMTAFLLLAEAELTLKCSIAWECEAVNF
jgi:hypothetical protein